MWVTKNGQVQEIDDGTLSYWRGLGWVEWQPDAGTEPTVAPAWAATTAYLAGQLSEVCDSGIGIGLVGTPA